MKRNLLVAAVAAICFASPAFADTVPIYNTGVDSTGAVLSSGSDPHYTVTYGTAVPSSSTLGTTDPTASAATIASNGAWVSSPTSNWIGNGDPGAASGYYTFTTTFDLTGYDPLSAILSGSLAADDSAFIYLNGHNVGSTLVPNSGGGVTNNGYASFTPFTVNGLSLFFTSGTNVLQIVDENDGAGYGVNLTNMSLTADKLSSTPVAGAVPEPATWAMMLLGFGAIGVSMRRRAKLAQLA